MVHISDKIIKMVRVQFLSSIKKAVIDEQDNT